MEEQTYSFIILKISLLTFPTQYVYDPPKIIQQFNNNLHTQVRKFLNKKLALKLHGS